MPNTTPKLRLMAFIGCSIKWTITQPQSGSTGRRYGRRSREGRDGLDASSMDAPVAQVGTLAQHVETNLRRLDVGAMRLAVAEGRRSLSKLVLDRTPHPSYRADQAPDARQSILRAPYLGHGGAPPLPLSTFKSLSDIPRSILQGLFQGMDFMVFSMQANKLIGRALCLAAVGMTLSACASASLQQNTRPIA